jgi:bacterioferritin
MPAKKIDHKQVLAVLNAILEHEYAGVVRYTHYALNAYGFSRIPIVGWANENADESLAHARLAGEHITNIGGHPSMKMGKLVDSGRHDVETMLQEARAHEAHAIDAYTELLRLVEGRDVALEEYARSQVATETEDLKKIEKMLRKPGS